ALHEPRSEYGKVDMRRPPAIEKIAKRVGSWLHSPKPVFAVGIGNCAATAAEIRVDRRDITVIAVAIAAPSVGLPKFQEDVGDRSPVPVLYLSMDDDPLADRLTFLRVIQNEIVVERTKFAGAEYWPAHLGQRVLER